MTCVCGHERNQHKPDCTICFRVRRYHLATCHTYECKECIYMKSNAHCLKHNELYCSCWHRKADHDDRGYCKVCKCDWFHRLSDDAINDEYDRRLAARDARRREIREAMGWSDTRNVSPRHLLSKSRPRT